jgi:uncharacterized DUF497 family protein
MVISRIMTENINVPERLGIPDYEFRVVFGGTTVDYDSDKEEANRKKHGYSLLSGVHLLERLLLQNEGSSPHAVREGVLKNGEVRHMHLSVDDNGKVVLMVTTMRPNEVVRVISFRSVKRHGYSPLREPR